MLRPLMKLYVFKCFTENDFGGKNKEHNKRKPSDTAGHRG